MGDHRGLLSRAEGCWTFDARDRMPRSSRLPVHAIIVAAGNATDHDAVTLPRERVRSSARIIGNRPGMVGSLLSTDDWACLPVWFYACLARSPTIERLADAG